MSSNPRIPLATYRLQFNRSFTFKQALDLVDYLAELGISDCYASPILKARSGSSHGYDVLDYSQINPELGTEEEFIQFASRLKEKEMGLLLDIVPNHMCVADDTNKWWNDVLENGPSSLYASYFSIVWKPLKVELKNKVLIPVLDQQYGKVIENQDLKVVYETGAFFVEYKSRHFPLNPRTWNFILEPVSRQTDRELGEEHPDALELQSVMTALKHLPNITESDPERVKERHREKEIIKKRLATLTESQPAIEKVIQAELKRLNGQKGEPHSFDQLEELLSQQAYRLSYWRVTNDEINYRRFFDINDLASLKVEDPVVFNDMHELILRFIKEGWVTGVRVDHVDGLFDPQKYLYDLQQACLNGSDRGSIDPQKLFYVLVEKILTGNERLRPQWPIYGTTGYDFLNLLNGVFVARENRLVMQQIYDQFIDRHDEMNQMIYQCKKLILFVSMSSELHMLARQLEEISEQHRWSRDFTLDTLRSALRDVIACFPVYRSYIRLDDKVVSEEDRHWIITAIRQAKRYNPAAESSHFDFIESVLLLQDPEGLTDEQIAFRRHFIMRFQQLTGPVMAKGFEDTAFYRIYPLSSLNEVGMDPSAFGVSLDIFHEKNKERMDYWPHTLLATFTHDTKRSEDVRARLNILSENPEQWRETLYRWHYLNRDLKHFIEGMIVPDLNEEYLLYQTLFGSWPLDIQDEETYKTYIERIQQYMNKVLKEAKVHTSWVNPNQAYEEGISKFIAAILNPQHPFIHDLQAHLRPFKRAGLFNSLCQLILKLTVPGVPDFYQGSELWEFTLVDPDNRRSVDYTKRSELLQSIKKAKGQGKQQLIKDLYNHIEDGRIKLYMISELLALRKQNAYLFQQGSYEPLIARGEHAAHIVAFSRTSEGKQLIVITGRFFMDLLDPETLTIKSEVWADTHLAILRAGHYREILSGKEWSFAPRQEVKISELFNSLPFAVFESL